MTTWSGKALAYKESRSSVCGGTIPFIMGELIPGNLADIGCGCGDFTLAAATAGYQVTACDADPEMLKLATSLIRTTRTPNTPVPATIRLDKLPSLSSFTTNTFDNAVANFVVNHLDMPLKSLKGLARIVKPNGRVFTTVWTNAYLPHRDLVSQAISMYKNNSCSSTRLPQLDFDFERSVSGLAELNRAADLKVLDASLLKWDWHISWEKFWLGMTAGIGSTGEAFLALPETIQEKIRDRVWKDSAPYRDTNNHLCLPCQAALCVAVKE